MATPTQRTFRLPAVEGRPLEGAVLTAGVDRPVVVVCGDPPNGLSERLARAGLSVVTFRDDDPHALARILTALGDETLGLRPGAVGLLGHGAGGARAIAHAKGDASVRALVTWAASREAATHEEALAAGAVRIPRLVVRSDAGSGPAISATVEWFGRHLRP